MPTKETAAKTPRKAPAATAKSVIATSAPLDTTPIALGNIIRDRATGFQGVAIMKAEMIDGSTQFALQPKSKLGDDGESSVPQAWFVDVQLCEFVEVGVGGLLSKPHPETPFILGEEVEDLATKHRGIATERIFHINGCVHYTVVGKVTAEGKTVAHNIDWKRLKRVGKGITKDIVKTGAGDTPQTNKTPNEQPAARSRGGAPMRMAPSRSV